MKKYHFLLAMLCTSAITMAQTSEYSGGTPLANSKKHSNQFGYIKGTNNTPKSAARGSRAALLSEDFASWPPAGWAVTSGAASTITFPAAQAYHQGSDPSQGGTAEILYANGTDQHDEWLITPDVVLPATGNFRLYFDWFSSNFWHVTPNDNADITIKIVTGGGNNTPTDFAAATTLWQEDDMTMINAAGDNWPWEDYSWHDAGIDLTPYLGQTVNIAFHFYGMDAAQHQWDNIIVDTVPDNDLEMREVYHHNFISNWYNTITPLEEASAMEFGADIRNWGALTQPRTHFTVDVSGPDTYMGASDSIDLQLAGMVQDSTIFFNSGWTPNAEGTYTVIYTAGSDSTDAIPYSNADTNTFEIGGDAYAKDNGIWGNSYYSPIEDNVPSPVYATYGNVFTISGADAHCRGVRTAFVTGSDAGAIVTAELWHWNNPGGGFFSQGNWSLVASKDYTIQSADITTTEFSEPTWVDIKFTNPQALDAGQSYLVGITIPPSPDSVNIPISGVDLDNGAVVGGADLNNPGEGANWYGIGFTPMVRMIMLHSGVGIEESTAANGFRLEQNVPNPFNGLSRIKYELGTTAQVTVALTDLMGRTVHSQDLGNKSTGKHEFTIDGSKLSPGIYHYTLNAGTDSATRKLVVSQ